MLQSTSRRARERVHDALASASTLRSWRARERVNLIQMYALGSASVFRIVFEFFLSKVQRHDSFLYFLFVHGMYQTKYKEIENNLLESLRLLYVLLFEQQHQECYTSYSTLNYYSYSRYSKYCCYSLSYSSCSSCSQLP